MSEKLLAGRPVIGVGRPPYAVALLQKFFRGQARKHAEASQLLKEKAFVVYLNKMAIVLHKIGHAHQDLSGNPILSEAILDRVTAEYQLLKDAGIPTSIIKKYGHSFTVFHADDIYKKSHDIFGRDVESEPLVRTAAFQVFMKKYESVEAAKKAYDLNLSAERTRARKLQTKDLVLPELAGLQRDNAFELLKPIISRIGDNFLFSGLGKEDAEQAAGLAAIELLNVGERNSEKILDVMIREVTEQAAVYAAYRIKTKPLPSEK